MPETKTCSRCFKDKPISEYYLFKSGPQTGHIKQPCKQCFAKQTAAYRKSNPAKVRKSKETWKINNPDKVKQGRSRYYQTHAKNPDNIKNNPACTLYLGYYISESVLSKTFKNIVRMPANHPGYDFECNRHYKIDVKSSTMLYQHGKTSYWAYIIKENKIPDYFLIIAWDTRENLKPLHIWLIPSNLINTKKILYIGNTTKSLSKWKKYERPIKTVLSHCKIFKAKQLLENDVEEVIQLPPT